MLYNVHCTYIREFKHRWYQIIKLIIVWNISNLFLINYVFLREATKKDFLNSLLGAWPFIYFIFFAASLTWLCHLPEVVWEGVPVGVHQLPELLRNDIG